MVKRREVTTEDSPRTPTSTTMPMPRRKDYVIQETNLRDHCLVMQRNDLAHEKPAPPPADFDDFLSLSFALGAMELEPHEPHHNIAAVEEHPRFREAIHEYMTLMTVMLPSCVHVPADQLCSPKAEITDDAAGVSGVRGVKIIDQTQLDDAFECLILLLRRRRGRAEQFYATIHALVNEYTALEQDLRSAERLLKGSHLNAKIQQMKETVKRKYGAKVPELVEVCAKKQRRVNLPRSGVEVMEQWFGRHWDSPYPSEEEKRALAAQANLKEDQVSNWFVNARKRNWRPLVAGARKAVANIDLASGATR